MIKSEPKSSSASDFDRPKLLLFKFLAHQIHPFAYAVNTFLRPALDDCLALIHSNPQDTFNVLSSLTQTFIRFAPESELIYDDIQQFAIKLKDAIDQCFTQLDANSMRQSSQLLESIHRNLSTVIEQQNTENVAYTNMYKNISAVLTSLEKINSLPVEMQTISLDKILSVQQPSNAKETKKSVNEQKGDTLNQNGYSSQNMFATSNQRLTTVTPPPGIWPISNDKPTTVFSAPIMNKSDSSRSSSVRSAADSKKIAAIPPTSVPTAISSSRPTSTISYEGDYEVTDAMTQPVKKPTAAIASFPPRSNASVSSTTTMTNGKSLPTSTGITKNDLTNGHYSSALLNQAIQRDHTNVHAKVAPTNKLDMTNTQCRDAPSSTSSYDMPSYSSNPSVIQKASVTSSNKFNHHSNGDDSANRDNHQTSHTSTNSESKSIFDQFQSYSTSVHITDKYMQEFGHKQNRPTLHGELFMTYGKPQSGPQATCLPIGVGLSYDELTLLSCDVHRSAQQVRLFDVQTGQLKHIISSNQQMKFHRPGAVMSNARNNILIVERDSIYITEPDGHWIQTLSHRSIKQLYGIATYHDRYILTIDSKASDNQAAENCRLLLFDPNCGQLVFEQKILINRQPEDILRQQYTSHLQGKILPESTSKPRFIAVRNDDIYIADLGRSLIYGVNLRNECDLAYTSVFGGNGRGHGEMVDPAGLFIDSGGNIVNADSKNDRIQLFSSDGQYKATFKLDERLKRPSGICTNRDGTQFYVSCYLAGCVRAFNVGY